MAVEVHGRYRSQDRLNRQRKLRTSQSSSAEAQIRNDKTSIEARLCSLTRSEEVLGLSWLNSDGTTKTVRVSTVHADTVKQLGLVICDSSHQVVSHWGHTGLRRDGTQR